MTRAETAAYFRARGLPHMTTTVIRRMIDNGVLRAYRTTASTSGRLYHVRVLPAEADVAIAKLLHSEPVVVKTA